MEIVHQRRRVLCRLLIFAVLDIAPVRFPQSADLLGMNLLLDGSEILALLVSKLLFAEACNRLFRFAIVTAGKLCIRQPQLGFVDLSGIARLCLFQKVQ